MREEGAPQMWVQTSSRATVEGEDLVDAQPAFDSRNNEPIVSFRFNQKGALRFGKLTQENVGRPFAIILDSVVMSAPVINEPILGGTGQISGRFTTEEASRSGDRAALRRAAGQAHGRRGAHGGSEPRLRLDPRRRHRDDDRPRRRGRIHGHRLWSVRRVRQHRAARQPRHAGRPAVGHGRHADPAGHCRAVADARHGGRFQRARL